MFAPNSPRLLDMEKAAEFAEVIRGRARIVAVVVNPGDKLIRRIVSNIKPDFCSYMEMKAQNECVLCGNSTAYQSSKHLQSPVPKTLLMLIVTRPPQPSSCLMPARQLAQLARVVWELLLIGHY